MFKHTRDFDNQSPLVCIGADAVSIPLLDVPGIKITRHINASSAPGVFEPALAEGYCVALALQSRGSRSLYRLGSLVYSVESVRGSMDMFEMDDRTQLQLFAPFDYVVIEIVSEESLWERREIANALAAKLGIVMERASLEGSTHSEDGERLRAMDTAALVLETMRNNGFSSVQSECRSRDSSDAGEIGAKIFSELEDTAMVRLVWSVLRSKALASDANAQIPFTRQTTSLQRLEFARKSLFALDFLSASSPLAFVGAAIEGRWHDLGARKRFRDLIAVAGASIRQRALSMSAGYGIGWSEQSNRARGRHRFVDFHRNR